ncbi:MAG: ribonucleoside-triphosphate reductase, partial [Candidatus Vogelbacteria bacterium]|nr:ribonucleoside-triphosphate reductase [Candidatus Vogelbacteria bacterium]
MKKKRVVSLKKIKKRDGTIVAFDEERISNAVWKAMKASGEGTEAEARLISGAVVKDLLTLAKKSDKIYIPAVEEVQDNVEKQLILHNFVKTSKSYILYRERRSELRREKGEVPKEVKELATASKQYFRNQLSEFVYYTTYSKWIPEKNRRETWLETIDRYVDFMRENLGDKLTDKEYAEVREYLLDMKALGSMRLLWGAGKAARKTNVCAYNCSYIAPGCWQDFAEVMYVLMCGTGIGFSVEPQAVESLPMIRRQIKDKPVTYIIPDSKEGWCDAFTLGLKTWSEGRDIIFDYSEIRPQGARLATMGGRASGPGPLRALLDFSREKMLARQGRRLSTLDVHDIICKTGEVVVMGGVRRSALISLSALDDQAMREAKNGQFYLSNPQRSMANNSAVYNDKPTPQVFLDEWINLVKSQSGERGIFNRGGLKYQLPARRLKLNKPDEEEWGTNPCGEIILRSKQFCNLSEVVARAEDTEETLLEKVRVATILGTYQASLTHFPYLSKEWQKNCEEEALLGVSITGQFDCPAVSNAHTLRRLKEVA